MFHTKCVMGTIEQSVFDKPIWVVDFILVCVTKIIVYVEASYDYKTSFDYLDYNFNLAGSGISVVCCGGLAVVF